MEHFDPHKSARIIANHVFHSFPYQQFRPNFQGPHAEDCEGCIVNVEVEKLVEKLQELSPVEYIISELEKEREKRKALSHDRWEAFNKAGKLEDGSVADLVETLVNERDSLLRLLKDIDNDLSKISKQIQEEK